MAEQAPQKLDIQDLLKQWERVALTYKKAGEDSDALTEEDKVHTFRFTAQVMNALPELARVYIQHDDAMRAAFYVSEKGYAMQAEMLNGASFEPENVAKAFIAMARHFGWKPPRECD